MRFMVIVKATKDSEAGMLPSQQLLTEMGRFNEELVKSGVMLAGEGLQPSSKGARVKFSGNTRTVIDGPFAETNELIAGYWVWQCESKQEAIEWANRCPNPAGDGKEGEIEIRQVFEAEDFGAEFTPELREQEERLRAQVEKKKKKEGAHALRRWICLAGTEKKLERLFPHGQEGRQDLAGTWRTGIPRVCGR